MLKHPRLSLLIALLCLPLAALASYSPGQLILRLTSVPARNIDGEIQSTGITAVDALLNTQLATIEQTFAPLLREFRSVESIVSLSFPEHLNLDSLENAIASDPGVEWVTRNYHYRPNSLDEGLIPNDSLYDQQWWLNRISASLAWEISQGDSTVIIGIIDTGIDYLHPDLVPNLWINWADADSDGVDDDDNGFTDDVFGWDFVDAPTLPATGDHLVRDNDPMDELGHGTYVAGIAAASTDNQTCFASVGYNCRIMSLRAGNSQGFLEEDDISAALLYGAANGAAIINMSFGDVVASPLLREAVILAHEAGVVLVASAGNANSEAIHYPSGFAEVIGVGATDSLDRRAYRFSNYGPSVDVMAPGDYILSTILGGDCGEWIYPTGTSYAAPMVAGVAGLVLSVNPQLSPDDVAQIIVSTADDIAEQDWDPETVHGRVNARRAVEQAEFGSDVVARISSPHVDQGLISDFAVFGEAWGAAFEHYDLYYGLGENPEQWQLVSSSIERSYGDSLGWITLPPDDGVMIVRLVTYGADGAYSIDHVHVYIQRSAPQIDSLWSMRMLDYDTYGDLIQVETDQITTASFILTNALGDSLREDFGYVADEHAGVLTQTNHPGQWTVRVRLENQAGLDTVSEPFEFSIDEPPFSNNLWERTTTNLLNGYLSPFYTDYDCNNMPEVWLQPIEGEVTSGFLEPFEWDGSQFSSTGNYYGVHIPQATGDADGDGLIEVMARFGQTTRIWEQTQFCGVLDSLVFEDTTSFVGAGFVDLDSQDGRQEIVARVYTANNGATRPRYVIFTVGSDYELTPLDTIPNGTSGSNDLGPPIIRTGDIDQDGQLDFLYGDYDGDVIWCERSGNDIQQVWSARLPINDATSWHGFGDLNGDGDTEIVAGCRSNISGGSESQRRSQHWEYFVFERSGDNNFVAADSIFILGNENVSVHPASVTVSDVDADGRADILISAYPDFYIISHDAVSGDYLPRWYYTPSQSNTALAADFDSNGVNEFFVSDGSSVLRIEAASASGQRPAPPLNLRGDPVDAHSIVLEWNAVTGADSYSVFMATAIPDFTRVLSTQDPFAVIDSLPEDELRTYAVTSLSVAFPIQESVLSNYVSLAANAAPSLEDTAMFIEPHFVRLRFSEPMGSTALAQWSYRLDDLRFPDVVTSDEGGRVIVLSFVSGLSAGWHSVTLAEVHDAQQSILPISERTAFVQIAYQDSGGPRLLSHRILGGPSASLVEIVFTESMSTSALNPANYRMESPRSVQSVTGLESDNSRIHLQLDPRYPVGALDLPARIMLRNLTSVDGIPMDTSAGRADIVLGGAAPDISQVFVYPNPYRGIGPDGEHVVVFAGLPERATIRVFTVQGLLVRTIEHQNSTGASRWDLKNDDGDAIASGVYLFTAENGGETVRGKLVVMR